MEQTNFSEILKGKILLTIEEYEELQNPKKCNDCEKPAAVFFCIDCYCRHLERMVGITDTDG